LLRSNPGTGSAGMTSPALRNATCQQFAESPDHRTSPNGSFHIAGAA
jgi:hypothetical protein